MTLEAEGVGRFFQQRVLDAPMRVVALRTLSLGDGRMTGFGGEIARVACLARVEQVLSRRHAGGGVMALATLAFHERLVQGGKSNARRGGRIGKRRRGLCGRVRCRLRRLIGDFKEEPVESVSRFVGTTQDQQRGEQRPAGEAPREPRDVLVEAHRRVQYDFVDKDQFNERDEGKRPGGTKARRLLRGVLFTHRSNRARKARALFVPLLVVSGCATSSGPLFPTLDSSRVWPAPPEAPRLRLLGMIRDSGDLRAGRSAGEALGDAVRGKRPAIRFSSPQGIAVKGTDLVAVADGSGGAVHLLDLTARTQTVVFGSATERFGCPMGVTWDGGRLFVADAQRHEVVELDQQGNWIDSFGADELIRPVGVVLVAARHELWVVDGGGHRVVGFDLRGDPTCRIGTRGSATGEFNFPTHIAVGRDRIAVADSGNFRVQLLDLDGNVVSTIGKNGDGAGDLSLPKGLAFDRDDHLYVVDAHFEVVQVFDRDGRLLLAFGEEGSRAGEFSLPTGIAIDEGERVWVSDSGNRRLQVFEMVKP